MGSRTNPSEIPNAAPHRLILALLGFRQAQDDTDGGELRSCREWKQPWQKIYACFRMIVEAVILLGSLREGAGTVR